MGKRLTKKGFIEKANSVHDGKYDYSKSEYHTLKTKITIICPEHGEFLQTPYQHLIGQGCPVCGKKRMWVTRGYKYKETFIDKSKAIHNDKYDYSKTEYSNAHEKVCIICHEKDENGVEHGEFWQTPNSHLNGNGCPKCAKNVQLTNNEFIQKAIKVHGNKYNYSKTNYVSGHVKVCILCPEHGEFWQDPYAHINGQGCPKCAGIGRSNSEEFIEKACKVHGDLYDYSKVTYINNSSNVCIICPEHGEFWQTPNNHLNGKGCSKCNSKGNSKIVRMVENALKDRSIVYEREKSYKWLKRKGQMLLDIYLPEYNVAIECQGIQHFIPQDRFGGDIKFKDNYDRDTLKFKLCEEHGIKIYYFAKKEYPYFSEVFTNTEELINEICKNM